MATSNAEVRYREGYKEGAQELLRGIEQFLPVPVSNDVYEWLEQSIENWLLSAKKIAEEGNIAPSLPPPPFRTPRSN